MEQDANTFKKEPKSGFITEENMALLTDLYQLTMGQVYLHNNKNDNATFDLFVRKAISLDAKMLGDLVYVLGIDASELGGSEYFAMMGEQSRGKPFIGNSVPKVIPHLYARTYKDFSKAVEKGLVASAQSINRGGLGVAIAKTAMGGRLGMNIDLRHLKGKFERDDFAFYSESQGRILLTVAPMNQGKFERLIYGTPFSLIGEVNGTGNLAVIGTDGKAKLNERVDSLLGSYKSKFSGY